MKQVYKIGSSEDLNPAQATLLVEIGEAHCCFAIIDYANHMMVQACFYAKEESDSDNLLRNLIDEHQELKNSFRQSVIGYYMNENVLIPSRFYKYEESRNLLDSMYEKDSNVVISESVPEWQLYNAYHVPSAIHELFGRNFASGKFWHMYSVILKNAIYQGGEGSLLVDLKKESFSIVAVRDSSLLLAQIYSYTRTEDVLYWLLKVSRQFSVSQQEVRVVISGLVDRQSAIFKELYQYFLHIDFAPVENDIRLSQAFEEYPVHFFSSFFKLASCAS